MCKRQMGRKKMRKKTGILGLARKQDSVGSAEEIKENGEKMDENSEIFRKRKEDLNS